MSRYMTRENAIQVWREFIKPSVPKGDMPWMRESWNDYVDMLAKDGQISWKQADNWAQPKECR